jgi:hypothetical protein
MLQVSLSCPGPAGGNGCPEELAPLVAESAPGQDPLRLAFSGLVRDAEAQGWRRGTDNLIRCSSCAAHQGLPPVIAGIPIGKWWEALDRFCAGEPPSVWGGQDGLPTARQFNNVIHGGRYPALRERWMQGPTFKADRKERSESLSEERWTAVLACFLAGDAKEAICTDEPGVWPSAKMWNGRMARDAAFRSAVNLEHARRRRERDGGIDWEAALAAFAGGETLASFRNRPGFPDPNRWHRRWTEDEDFRARATAALKARPRKGAARYDQVLQLRRDGLTLAEACEAAAISTTAVINARRRDPLFAAAYEAATVQARAAQLVRPIERLPPAIRERKRYAPSAEALARRAADREANRADRMRANAEREARRKQERDQARAAMAALLAEDRARRAAEREAERAAKPQRPPAFPKVPHRARPVGWGAGQRKPRIIRDRPKAPAPVKPITPKRAAPPIARTCPPHVFAAARDLVAERMHIPAADLVGHRGTADQSLARFVFRYLLVVEMEVSAAQVAQAVLTDKSTIAHGLAAIEDRRDDPEFDALMDDLAAELRDRLGDRLDNAGGRAAA